MRARATVLSVARRRRQAWCGRVRMRARGPCKPSPGAVLHWIRRRPGLTGGALNVHRHRHIHIRTQSNSALHIHRQTIVFRAGARTAISARHLSSVLAAASRANAVPSRVSLFERLVRLQFFAGAAGASARGPAARAKLGLADLPPLARLVALFRHEVRGGGVHAVGLGGSALREGRRAAMYAPNAATGSAARKTAMVRLIEKSMDILRFARRVRVDHVSGVGRSPGTAATPGVRGTRPASLVGERARHRVADRQRQTLVWQKSEREAAAARGGGGLDDGARDAARDAIADFEETSHANARRGRLFERDAPFAFNAAESVRQVLFEPQVIERLTDNIMRGVERRIRIERERRGL